MEEGRKEWSSSALPGMGKNRAAMEHSSGRKTEKEKAGVALLASGPGWARGGGPTLLPAAPRGRIWRWRVAMGHDAA
jgi:hypothetical protein